jgi:mannose-1-phosphate guanylyltransferase
VAKNVILCGGSGTRLWPVSRTLFPKQFVKLFGGMSLFQLTASRNRGICKERIIVANDNNYFLAIDQMCETDPSLMKNSTFLLESAPRNTAAAIALSAFSVPEDEILFVTPSDHFIKNLKSYREVVQKGFEVAKDGYLVVFGIDPTYPETGYGYIEAVNMDVKMFKEKPNLETAKKYLEINKSGSSVSRFYWNSGMFCFKAKTFLDELNTYAPDIYKAAKNAFNNILKINENQYRVKKEDMLKIPENSIDYAVMEKSKNVKMISSNIQWNDLGSFDALFQELEKDENRNSVILSKNLAGKIDIEKPVFYNSKNNLVIAEREIVAIDVEDLIVADTSDALLISKKGSSQKVKEIVNILKERNSTLVDVHRLAHRPWGTYEVLLDADKYKIKRITVKPGSRLSLQKHFHRNEHWVVVSGTATVTVGDEKFILSPNESTYIKMGQLHRLENSGKIDLVIIEVQIGEYTGEDDIVRVEDDYKRS